jgi:CDP-paratose 2-epimerase
MRGQIVKAKHLQRDRTAEDRAHHPSPVDPKIGLLEWIHYGDRDHVERLLADMRALGLTSLRTGVSWADSHRPKGWDWLEWLVPRLAQEVELLPCFLYTPPSLGIAPKTSSPPQVLSDYTGFIGSCIERFGDCFEYVELWNEPNNLSEWDWTLDPGWLKFVAMAGQAAEVAHAMGKKTVLGGMSPIDPEWLAQVADEGLLEHIDVVGIHGFPGSWEEVWESWPVHAAQVRQVLRDRGYDAEVWITETGFSTWHHDARGQMRAFVDVIDAVTGDDPAVERAYWYSAYDLHPDVATVSGFHLDEREYHFGLKHTDDRPKPLYHLWAKGGIRAVRHAVRLSEAPASVQEHCSVRPAQTGRGAKAGPSGELLGEHCPTLITGGAGFIGTNVADYLLTAGYPVIVYDSLNRPGVERNLNWLCEKHGGAVQVEIADVRDRFSLRRAMDGVGRVFHFAGQVAVTTSLRNPIYDYEVNIGGTLNLLEALRERDNPPPLVFTSTNKVYGALPDVELARNGTRYEPVDRQIREHGIGETRPLDFHSPYGCSKGAADQYVIDYARTFGLPAVVFRMSCIYGPHQHGTEDQGWIAHFIIRAIQNKPITIFGDGMQVRDALYVEDLVDAFLLAQENIDRLSGQSFNIGGGPENTISLVELLDLIEALHHKKPPIGHAEWRAGDQRYYVSDISRFREATGWRPQVGVREGVGLLYDWLMEYHVQDLSEMAEAVAALSVPLCEVAEKSASGSGVDA